MPIILHGVEGSGPCRAVLITAKAIGVDIQLKIVDVMAQATKTEEFMKMNPSHTIPTLDDNGFYLWESRPIMSYLVDKYGKNDKLYPKDVNARALVDQMLHFDAGSLNAKIGQYFYPQFLTGAAPIAEHEDAMRDKLTTLNKIVGQSPFAAGKHVTIADISIVTSLYLPSALGFSFDKYPNVVKYVANVKKALPVYDQVAKNGEKQIIEFAQARMKK